MSNQMELAKQRFYGDGGLLATDVKLFPRSNRDSTPEQMAEQINKVLSQVESGDYDLVSFE